MPAAPLLRIDEFTDPNCPFAFSAEPVRRRLEWLFGDQIEWQPRMVVLSSSREEYAKKGLTPQMIQAGYTRLASQHGMPIDTTLRDGLAATRPSAAAVVAARLHAPEHEKRILRALRVRTMGGPRLLDDPTLIDDAIRDSGLEPAEIHGWVANDPKVDEVLEQDMRDARNPAREALALDHKLADWEEGRRYTCPSYEIRRIDDAQTAYVPGFMPFEAYETAIANLAPELTRREQPESIAELLDWADAPLATAEVAAILGVGRDEARVQLVRGGASETPVGTDGYWTI